MIDHTGHPHPSTPKARALCRANGGTGDITPKPKSAKATVKRTPKLTEERVPRAAKKEPVAAIKKSSGITQARHDALMKALNDEDNQLAALASAPVGINAGDYRGFNNEDEKRAVKRYIAEGYGHINTALRGQSTPTDRTKEQIKNLDAVMERSKLPEDVAAFRGIAKSGLLFGDALNGDMTGLEWHEPAFSSTTVNEDAADDFILGDYDDDDFDPSDEGGSMKMRIVMPKGTKAIQGSELDEEAELIVARSSNFRVIKDRGVDSQGVRILDVELISQGGKDVA